MLLIERATGVGRGDDAESGRQRRRPGPHDRPRALCAGSCSARRTCRTRSATWRRSCDPAAACPSTSRSPSTRWPSSRSSSGVDRAAAAGLGDRGPPRAGRDPGIRVASPGRRRRGLPGRRWSSSWRPDSARSCTFSSDAGPVTTPDVPLGPPRRRRLRGGPGRSGPRADRRHPPARSSRTGPRRALPTIDAESLTEPGTYQAIDDYVTRNLPARDVAVGRVRHAGLRPARRIDRSGRRARPR